MPYIFSTLANDNAYTSYSKGGSDLPIPGEPVLVKGGAGVANDRVITPRGVMTEISDEQYASIKDTPVFLRHVKNGFIKVEDRAHDPEAVAADMTGRDNSAPLVPQDYEKGNQKAPTHSDKGNKGNRR